MTGTTPKEVLTQRLPEGAIGSLLLPRRKWCPYPRNDDREAWDSLPDSARQICVGQGRDALASERLGRLVFAARLPALRGTRSFRVSAGT